MMKEILKANIDERPSMIIVGVISLFAIIGGFIWYLFFLHRISLLVTIMSSIILILIYFPRFVIIKKLKTKDEIKIIDDFLLVNGVGINFDDIIDFRVQEKKPQVIFFINNKMIVFKECTFRLKLKTEELSFNVIGSEKIKLLKEFLELKIKREQEL